MQLDGNLKKLSAVSFKLVNSHGESLEDFKLLFDTFAQHPGSAIAWIIGDVVVMAGTIFFLKRTRNPLRVFGDRSAGDSPQQRAKNTTRV